MARLDRALAGGRCGAMDALRGIAHRPAVVRRSLPRGGGILGVGALLDVEAAVELSERLRRAAPDEGGNQSPSASSSASSSGRAAPDEGGNQSPSASSLASSSGGIRGRSVRVQKRRQVDALHLREHDQSELGPSPIKLRAQALACGERCAVVSTCPRRSENQGRHYEHLPETVRKSLS
jgi:hypothetical protein